MVPGPPPPAPIQHNFQRGAKSQGGSCLLGLARHTCVLGIACYGHCQSHFKGKAGERKHSLPCQLMRTTEPPRGLRVGSPSTVPLPHLSSFPSTSLSIRQSASPSPSSRIQHRPVMPASCPRAGFCRNKAKLTRTAMHKLVRPMALALWGPLSAVGSVQRRMWEPRGHGHPLPSSWHSIQATLA